jgi:hypothetical protein
MEKIIIALALLVSCSSPVSPVVKFSVDSAKVRVVLGDYSWAHVQMFPVVPGGWDVWANSDTTFVFKKGTYIRVYWDSISSNRWIDVIGKDITVEQDTIVKE